MKKIIYILLSTILGLNIIFLGYNIYNHIEIKKKVKIDNYTLKLNGESTISLDINEEYKEDGVSITGGKNDDIKTSGKVDTSKVGTYLIRYYYDTKSINDYSIYRVVNIKDDKAPTIKLKGSSKVSLYVGSKYKDAGVTVTDNSNENLKDKVTIEGKVNNKKVGTYKLTYKVKDSAGNEASITRTVKVKNRPIVTRLASTKVSINEKGATKKQKLNLAKNDNTVTSMKFTNSGISITGYVKNKSANYTIKLCNSNCTSYNMNVNNNYYSGNINLDNLANGIYKMKIVSGSEMDVIDELEESSRIVRAKVGNKLVTVSYPNKNPNIKIEDFSYEYDILIDAGHGGSDTGATNQFVLEKNINLEQSLYEKRRYEEHGLKVKMIRTNDTYGLMMGTSKYRVHRRGYAMGYYGAISRYVYSNHHNSIGNNYYSGYEIILANQGTMSTYSVPYKIAASWKENYPLLEDHLRIYGRNYDTNVLLNKTSGQTYNIRNFYAVIRIPYELYNVYPVIYEGSYLSNLDDYNWYKDNYKKMSEIKIKAYVESLGKTYIPVGEA